MFDQNGESIYLQRSVERFLINFFASSKFHIISTFKKLNITNHINITKIALVVKNKFTVNRVLAKLDALFGQYCNFHLASANYVIEVTSIKTNKGLATSLYMQDKQMDPEDAVHIGDSDSDFTTRPFVGHLVAMKNGTSKLKSACWWNSPKKQKWWNLKIFY
nr:HAD hydrolase family protein [Mycoplasmopsis bovis]